MHRTALARRHRPRRFEELVGQDHVASTLRAAVESDRVAHAYLFCGPRGIGKTTAARILAMALNCPHRDGGEPCGVCESCERIWSGRTSLDVVEIDAASHRGVDDARDLRERAMYAPTGEDRFKVYIIDEAHMLTRDAWNALLKILEEPPPRVIFAFATTEPRKIEQSAAPVLSRCQRFDFRRVSVPDIVGRLQTVLEREGIEADQGALLSIARRAEGGVRDALSLLDQVLSFTGDRVRADDVRRMLGLVEEERYLEFFEILARRERRAVFPFVQRLLDAGFDPGEFVRGLADALRILLVLRSDPGGEGLDLLPDSRARFAETAQRFSEVDLLRYLLAVSDFETSGRFRRSSQQRIQLEVLLLRLVSMDSAVELQELLAAAGGGRRERPGKPELGEREGLRKAAAVPERGPEAPGVRGKGSPGGPEGSPPRRQRGGRARGGELPGAERQPAADRPEAAPRGVEAGEGGGGHGGDVPPPRGGERGPSEGQGGDRELMRVWREALSDAARLGGQAVALRGARVEALRGSTLSLRVPEGLAEDLRAFLDDRRRSGVLRRRLADALGADPASLSFEVNGEGGARRLTADEVRARRLSELMAMDPRLREAVEELDLTLKE